VTERLLERGPHRLAVEQCVHGLVGEGRGAHGPDGIPGAPAEFVDQRLGPVDGVGVELDGGRTRGVAGEQQLLEPVAALHDPGAARQAGVERGAERVGGQSPLAQLGGVALLIDTARLADVRGLRQAVRGTGHVGARPEAGEAGAAVRPGCFGLQPVQDRQGQLPCLGDRFGSGLRPRSDERLQPVVVERPVDERDVGVEGSGAVQLACQDARATAPAPRRWPPGKVGGPVTFRDVEQVTIVQWAVAATQREERHEGYAGSRALVDQRGVALLQDAEAVLNGGDRGDRTGLGAEPVATQLATLDAVAQQRAAEAQGADAAARPAPCGRPSSCCRG
jgi:hypothetical protein